MRTYLYTLILFIITIPNISYAQNWESTISVDSRFGYSSNTYLNPFISVWNPNIDSGFGLISVFGQAYLNKQKNSLNIIGAFIAEPFFKNRDVWRGGLGVVDYNRGLSSSLSVNLEAGSSYFLGLHQSRSVWAKPNITWFISPFTAVRLETGTYFQDYKNLADSTDITRRSDIIGIEFETWPTYNWQLKATLHGGFDNFTSPGEQFKSKISAGYLFPKGAKVSAHAVLEQYQFQTTTTSENQIPGPPIGGPGESLETTTNYDRIFSLGLDAHYPINQYITLFANAKGLLRNTTPSSDKIDEYKVSGGVRLTLQPKLGGKDNTFISPEWTQDDSQQMEIKVNYTGDGRLYLVGDFNNWNKAGIPLTRQSKNTYTGQIDVSVGAYEYKILLVEGTTERWLSFSNDIYTVDDGYGGENAMLLVEQTNRE